MTADGDGGQEIGMSLWGELRRRGVVKVGLAYLAFAWLIVQVASVVLPAFGFGDWVLRVSIIAFALGFPIAIVLAWKYELTDQGIRLDSGPTTPSEATVARG